MTEIDKLKDKACEAIDAHRDEIISLAEEIWANPELGFNEKQTSQKLVGLFRGLDLELESDLALTGVKAKLTSENNSPELPTVGVFGELDALINRDHPGSDEDTGAVHACGHHAQIANLAGVAFAFTSTGLVDRLKGSISLVGVPAEEYVDLDARRELMDEEKIQYFSGKQELIRRGHLDHIDAAVMVHAANDPKRQIRSRISMNGFLGKSVRYEGKSAHAGAEPEKGVNALNAANIGIEAINARRETFTEDEMVRVHPIITKGGEGVNVVPSDVRLKTYVRAKTVAGILETNEKVNQGLKGGALALGANVEISDFPGYLPFHSNDFLARVFDRNGARILGPSAVDKSCPQVTASTDLGDVSQLMPAIELSIGGFEGNLHSEEFRIVDEEMAYVIPAKITACSIIDLLGTEKNREKLLEQKPEVERTDEYLSTLNEMEKDQRAEFMK